MIREPYSNFVLNFSELNSFEMEHVGEILLVKFEEILFNRNIDAVLQFSLQDIHHAVIRAARDLRIELAETKMADAQMQLNRAQAHTFAPRKIKKTTAHNIKERIKMRA